MIFHLIPFEKNTAPKVSFSCELNLIPGQLSVTYTLEGHIDDLYLPEFAETRKENELWLSTCFELFIAHETQPHYLEFNFSPKGHWNSYFFSDYRIAASPSETERASPKFKTDAQKNLYCFEAEIPHNKNWPLPLLVGISSVLKHHTRGLSYWALSHPAKKPDFHDRRSFVTFSKSSNT